MDGSFRWLTVSPPAQPDLELVLMPINPGPMLDRERATLRGRTGAPGAKDDSGNWFSMVERPRG